MKYTVNAPDKKRVLFKTRTGYLELFHGQEVDGKDYTDYISIFPTLFIQKDKTENVIREIKKEVVAEKEVVVVKETVVEIKTKKQKRKGHKT